MVSNCCLVVLLLVVLFSVQVEAQLSTSFYDSSCPTAVAKVAELVQAAVARDRTIAPALLRLYFHDCFVRGCDASLLLDSPSGEKDATANANSLRGFELVDSAKAQIEAMCPGVVSCSDILSLATMYAIQAFGGLSWTVALGRRDGVVSSSAEADRDLPPPSDSFDSLVRRFNQKGFSMREMIVLSGAHTVGVTHCSSVEHRLYNFSSSSPTDPSIEPSFAALLKRQCRFGDGRTRIHMDQSSARDTWDFNFFSNVLRGRALFQSDDALKRNPQGLKMVQALNKRGSPFNSEFGAAMTKLSTLDVLTGSQGQIRRRCHAIN